MSQNSSGLPPNTVTIVVMDPPDWDQLPVGIHDMIRPGPDQHVIAAYIGDDGAGLIIVDYRPDNAAEIKWFGVLPHYQKRGVGSALMKKALELANVRGCDHMAACIALEGHTDILSDPRWNFYTGNGFRQRLDYQSGAPSTVWMVLPL